MTATIRITIISSRYGISTHIAANLDTYNTKIIPERYYIIIFTVLGIGGQLLVAVQPYLIRYYDPTNSKGLKLGGQAHAGGGGGHAGGGDFGSNPKLIMNDKSLIINYIMIYDFRRTIVMYQSR
jgi:hypothetical protein